MKKGAAISSFVKQMMTALTSKTVALKTKTTSIKTRLIIFYLLRNKKTLITSINHKLQALLFPHRHDSSNGGTANHDHDEQISVNHHNNAELVPDTYPDLTHLEIEGSVIELVKKSKGGEFRLEDEIDQVADLFIKRFHRQIMMQKQLSLKGNQELTHA